MEILIYSGFSKKKLIKFDTFQQKMFHHVFKLRFDQLKKRQTLIMG